MLSAAAWAGSPLPQLSLSHLRPRMHTGCGYRGPPDGCPDLARRFLRKDPCLQPIMPSLILSQSSSLSGIILTFSAVCVCVFLPCTPDPPPRAERLSGRPLLSSWPQLQGQCLTQAGASQGCRGVVSGCEAEKDFSDQSYCGNTCGAPAGPMVKAPFSTELD